MNVVNTFQADGYLPAGLVLNARLDCTTAGRITPQLSPLDQSGVAGNLACPIKQVDDTTMIRLKGKIFGAVVLGSLENSMLQTPEFIDYSDLSSPTVKYLDPLHDPCIIMTPMRFTGTVVVLRGTDAPIAELEVDTDWSVVVSHHVHGQWLPTWGAVSIPASLFVGSGLTRSIYSAGADTLSALFTQRGLEVAKASDDWLAIAPDVETEIKAVAAMTEVPNQPKVYSMFRITYETGGDTATAYISCVMMTVDSVVKAELDQHDLNGVVLIADPAASMMPFKLLPKYRLADTYDELGIAGLFSPESGDWIGVPMAHESADSVFSVGS